MGWRERSGPVRMQRVALVAPRPAVRDVLVRVADAGVVELDRVSTTPTAPVPPGDGTELRRTPRLSARRHDPAELVRAGREDLVAGEAELDARAGEAVVRDDVAAFAGWIPASEVPRLAETLAEVGGGLVPMEAPRGVDPPTLLRGGRARESFAPLVKTYGTVPYADVDPSVLAGLAYVLMFGMMFGDAGHGTLLLIAGLLLSLGVPRRWRSLRAAWPFVVGAGAVAILFGLLYGEFFGPTGVLPVLWLDPLDEPLTLMAVALGIGAVLLAGAQAVGTVNRWREGGWPVAVSAPSGLAGAALLAGLGLLVLGVAADNGWALLAGWVLVAAGVVLSFLGFLAASEGGPSGVAQATVEVLDAVIRVGANLVSFVRLAAFGLTHAAIGAVVWDGTTALWDRGGLLRGAAVALFAVGNAVAFALEALVAAVQALRLEYYELFSRVFIGEGRPFRPWHVPTDPGPLVGTTSAAPAASGRQP